MGSGLTDLIKACALAAAIASALSLLGIGTACKSSRQSPGDETPVRSATVGSFGRGVSDDPHGRGLEVTHIMQ